MEFIKEHTKNIELFDKGAWFYAYYHAGDDKDTIAYRADFDALPINDNIDKPWKSKIDGVGHKCGHDGHAATLCGFILDIDQNGSDKNIVFVFQHAEEIGFGGKFAAEAITEKNAKEVYAFHNIATGVPGGIVFVRAGIASCASTGMAIILKGKTAHASEPENGRNPVLAMSEIIEEIYKLEQEASEKGKNEDDDERLVMLTVLNIHAGGEEYGISAGEGIIRLVCRTTTEAEGIEYINRMEELSKEIAHKYELDVQFEYRDSFPELVNHKEAIDKFRVAAKNAGLETMDLPLVRGSEDFAYFTRITTGALVTMAGTQGQTAELHTERYDFDDTIIEPMVNLFTEVSKLPMI
jgi:amidohydrolase